MYNCNFYDGPTYRDFWYFMVSGSDIWYKTAKVFGRSNSNEWASSKAYIDSYGILYTAGWSQYWCSPYTGDNSMIVFKNNFDFDLYSGTANSDHWENWVEGWTYCWTGSADYCCTEDVT